MARATREHPQTQQTEASKTLPNHAVLAADRPNHVTRIAERICEAEQEQLLNEGRCAFRFQGAQCDLPVGHSGAHKRNLGSDVHPAIARAAALADAIKRGTPTNPTQHNGGTIADLERIVSELPNDPEEMNDARAAWAAYALAAFGASHRSDPDNLLPDLLCNLRHWCDRNGQDFDAELARANMHYEAEIAAEVQP